MESHDRNVVAAADRRHSSSPAAAMVEDEQQQQQQQQQDRLEAIRIKYAPLLSSPAAVVSANGGKNESANREKLLHSQNAVRALMLGRQEDGRRSPMEDGVHFPTASSAASREKIVACLSDPRRVQIARVLEESFSRYDEGAAAHHGGEPNSNQSCNPGGITPRKTSGGKVATLVQTLRQRREASEAAACAVAIEISSMIESSHKEEAESLRRSFLTKSLDDEATSDHPPSSSASARSKLRGGTREESSTTTTTPQNNNKVTPTQQHVISTNSRGQQQNLASSSHPSQQQQFEDGSSREEGDVLRMDRRRSNEDVSFFKEKRRGTPLDVIVTVPHLLQYGLFFPTLASVTVASPPYGGGGSIARTVEEIMCFTARQLALRVLHAAWVHVVSPVGLLLGEYESNFSLSLVSTAAVRAELHKWGCAASAAVVVDAAKDDDDDDVGFNRVAELYDCGMLQVVVSNQSLAAQQQLDTKSDDPQSTTKSQQGGVILRREMPLAATNVFRRWAAVARQCLNRHHMSEQTTQEDDARPTAVHLNSGDRPSAAFQLPPLMCYILPIRPGTMDDVHLKEQFSELI